MTPTVKERPRPYLIEGNGECAIPQLPNVIVKHFTDAILTAGSRVANGTRIYYECPAEHSLKGEDQNICEDSLWAKKFPYCESKYDPQITSLFNQFQLTYFQRPKPLSLAW